MYIKGRITIPIYRYICDACSHTLEQLEKFEQSRKKKCPVCKKYKLYVDCSGVGAAIYSTPQTLGHQASRNTERMGTWERQEKQQKLAEKHTRTKKKPKPFWRDTDKPDMSLAKLTPAQKKKYIQTGEKP